MATRVTVKAVPVITVNSPTICTGATAQLNATGGTTYAWSPSTGLSNANISNPISSATSTTNYTVTGTDPNGCRNTSAERRAGKELTYRTANNPSIKKG